MGYIRGFFKWRQIPNALAALLLLLVSLLLGFLNMNIFIGYKRSVIAWPPWVPYDASTDAQDPPPANLASAVRLVYLVNCIVVAIAIFYAGAFPLYKYNNSRRYPNKLQDNLATLGWFVLALHHMGNISMLILLTAGLRAWAGATPILLLLPTMHFVLKGLLPQLPPSLHYWLGLMVDITHFPLIALYAWRASTLHSAWELYGMAAELLHVLSVVPETWATCTRPAQTGSFGRPYGYDDNPPAGLRMSSHLSHTLSSSRTAPPAVAIELRASHSDIRRQGGAQLSQFDPGSLERAHESTSTDAEMGTEKSALGGADATKSAAAVAPPPPMLGDAHAVLAAAKEPPVYEWLVLMNVASFFFYGGLIAMQ